MPRRGARKAMLFCLSFKDYSIMLSSYSVMRLRISGGTGMESFFAAEKQTSVVRHVLTTLPVLVFTACCVTVTLFVPMRATAVWI